MIDIKVKCFMCNKEYTVTVADQDFNKWRAGAFVQDAFPYLTAGQRELLISNSCEKCFDNLFAPEKNEVPIGSRRSVS